MSPMVMVVRSFLLSVGLYRSDFQIQYSTDCLHLASDPCSVSCTNGGISGQISYEIVLDRG